MEVLEETALVVRSGSLFGVSLGNREKAGTAIFCYNRSGIFDKQNRTKQSKTAKPYVYMFK